MTSDLRSDRLWAIAEKVAMGFVAAAVAVLCIGLISAAVLVTTNIWSVPERGVFDQ